MSDEARQFDLAVCSEMVFLELDHLERVKRIRDLGYAIDFWDWTRKDIGALAATGAVFSSMTGYIGGTLADQAGADELLRTAELSIPVARQLHCARLNLHGTGLGENGLPVVPASGIL